MAERLAYAPLVALIVITGGIVLWWLAEQLGTWLLDRFGGDR